MSLTSFGLTRKVSKLLLAVVELTRDEGDVGAGGGGESGGERWMDLPTAVAVGGGGTRADGGSVGVPGCSSRMGSMGGGGGARSGTGLDFAGLGIADRLLVF